MDDEEQEEQEEQETYDIELDEPINWETLLSESYDMSTLNLSQKTLSDADIKSFGHLLQTDKVKKEISLPIKKISDNNF